MFWQLESFGIEPDEAIVQAMMYKGAQEGKVYTAYTKDWYYINYWFKDIQVSSHLKKSSDEKAEIVSSQLHAVGSKAYRLKIIQPLQSENPEDPLERRILACNADGSDNMLVVNVLNGDIQPCWKPGTIITVQMIAKALSWHVYTDEDEFAEATAIPYKRPDIDDPDAKMTAGIGTVLIDGFFGQHIVREEGQPTQADIEFDIVEESRAVITGRIEYFYNHKFLFDVDEEGNELSQTVPFFTMDTESLGKVDIDADIKSLSKEERAKLKAGAIVQASVVFSADALLDDTKTALELSPVRNYALIADVFENDGNFDRLWNAIADNCIYHSDGVTGIVQGKEKILNYLKSKKALMTKPSDQYHTGFAILTDVGSKSSKHADERCVVLRREDKNLAIVFLTMDDQELIKEIHLSTDPAYRFKLVDYAEWAE